MSVRETKQNILRHLLKPNIRLCGKCINVTYGFDIHILGLVRRFRGKDTVNAGARELGIRGTECPYMC